MSYWRNGGLPDDDERLARIVKLSPERWLSVRLAVSRRFHDKWRHKRIDEELEKADAKSLKAAVASAKSWESRGKRPRANAMRPHNRKLSVGKASQPSFKSVLYDLTLGERNKGPMLLSEAALASMGI